MRVLVLSPDFASHWTPLSIVADVARRAGHEVTVATGTTIRRRVESAGFEWRHLRLGRDSNDGVAVDREEAGATALARFVGATRAGAVATLALQADERLHDLLFEPERVARDVVALASEVRADRLVVDHVSFNSTLAARATGRPFTTVVPGHPSQLPVGTELYGFPLSWPLAITPARQALDDLRRRCERVAERFTARWNEALVAVDPTATTVDDAFRVTGDRVLLHWPRALHDPARTKLLQPGTAFTGPLTREESPVAPPGSGDDGRPLVYVALGTFLSHRTDVLVKLSDALRSLDVRVALATGATPVDRIGPLPAGWCVSERLPQVALLSHASVAVSHGGNNSVQEALAAGVRQVILPFSTDQFGVGADLERTDLAIVLDPNTATPDQLAEAIMSQLGRARPSPIATDVDAVVSGLE